MKRFLLIFLTLALLLGQSTVILCFAAESGSVATPSNAPMPMEDQPLDSGVPDLSGGTIVEVTSPIRPGFLIYEVPYGETSYDTLRGLLEDFSFSCVWQNETEKRTFTLKINWNYDGIDPFFSQKEQSLYGYLELPEGTQIAEGVNTSTSIRIKIDPPYPIELIYFAKTTNINAQVLPLGGSDELTDLFSSMTTQIFAYDNDKTRYKLSADTWDISRVDISKLGVYTATSLPTLKSKFTLAEGVELPIVEHFITVQEPGKPQINCFYSFQGVLNFPWILSDEQSTQSEQFSVWLREQGGAWKQVSELDYSINPWAFELASIVLTSGENYELQVDYPGGQTGILSFLYDETSIVWDYIDGDRDGNDNDDDTLDPPLTQPPPTPPETLPPPDIGGSGGSGSGGDGSDSGGSGSGDSDMPSKPTPPPTPPPVTPTPPVTPPVAPPPVTPPTNEAAGESSTTAESTSPTPPSPSNKEGSVSAMKTAGKDERQGYERVDGDTMEISGARLAWLLEQNKQFVPFGWNEVSLEIPVAFLKTLSLTSKDMLSVTLTRESDLRFTLALSAKGEPVTELESTRVRLPAPKPQHTYTLSLVGNALKTPVAYESGCVVFSITQTGTYELINEPIPLSDAPQSELPQETKAPPVLPTPTADDFLPFAVTGVVLLLGGGFWLWRRR